MAPRFLTFDVVHAYAQGLWPEILSGLGVDPITLKKRHGPCPGCGGKDRFRFHNKSLRGDFYCGGLGRGGDGFKLLQHVHGWNELESLKRVGAWLGLENGTKLTADEREAAKQKAAAQVERARKLAIEAQRKAAHRSWELWKKLPEQGKAGYLDRKKVMGFGVRFARGSLVVPVRRVKDGALTSLQWIPASADEPKTFITNSEIEGCCHFIGDFTNSLHTIAIVEGYATGASVHMATGIPTAVAFNRTNLLPVAQALRAKFPHARLIVAGDDDTQTEGNPGRTDATAAAKAVDGIAVFPEFSGVAA